MKMMQTISMLVATIALASSAIAQTAPLLEPGKKVPPLQVKEWFKGTPQTDITSGIVVVEFWATWCGPCVQAIPHITELAKKNRDVTFIGVSVWEDSVGGNIKAFVDKMGDKMDYNVGWSGNQEGMARTWLEPAAQNGIPCSFLIKDGVLQWVGHPLQLETVLTEVLDGTFNLAESTKSFRTSAEQTRKEMAIDEAIFKADEAFRDGKRSAARAMLAGLKKREPSAAADIAETELKWLSWENPTGWKRKVTTMAKAAKSGDEQALQTICRAALRLVNEKDSKRRALGKFAIDLAVASDTSKMSNSSRYGLYIYERLGDMRKWAACAKTWLAKNPKKVGAEDPSAEFRAQLEAKLAKMKK